MNNETFSDNSLNTSSAELESILKHFGTSDNRAPIYELLDNQLSVLHGRAQSLMQIAGVVITVTGFSGRIIADTSKVAQVVLVTGLTSVSCAAAIALIFVMPIRWVTTTMHLPAEEWIQVVLHRRAKKSRAIRAASIFMAVGMIFYIISVALMLLNPEAAELRRVR